MCRAIRLWAVAVPLLLLSCSKNHSLTVRIVTPPGQDDPFMAASQVRLTLLDRETTAAVASGHFSASIEIEAPQDNLTGQLQLFALDGAGAVVGRGKTPSFTIQKADFEVAVYVGKPGRVTSSELVLPNDDRTAGQGRKYLAACALRGKKGTGEPGLGALVVGGETEGVFPSSKAWVFKPAAVQFLDGGAVSKGRSGAVLLPSADANVGQQALLVGGAGQGSELLTMTERFDPSVSTLKDVWQTPAIEIGDIGKPGMVFPSAVEVQDNVFLVSGGTTNAISDQPGTQAVLVKRFAAEGADPLSRLGLSIVSPGLKVPRYRHSTTVLATATLLFGGLTPADVAAKKPVAELYLPDQNRFSELSFASGEPASRRGHVAGRMKNGQALIMGGYTEDALGAKTVLSTGLQIDVAARAFSQQAGVLKTGRYLASLHEDGGEWVICGGYDQNDRVLADCEFVSTETGQPSRAPAQMPGSRAEHQVVPLENDLWLFVGGVGADKKATAAVDFYTSK